MLHAGGCTEEHTERPVYFLNYEMGFKVATEVWEQDEKQQQAEGTMVTQNKI
jgi:hypothetical protein